MLKEVDFLIKKEKEEELDIMKEKELLKNRLIMSLFNKKYITSIQNQ